MGNLIKSKFLEEGGYFKFTHYGRDESNEKDAKIWLEDMEPDKLYKISSVDSNVDFYADGPNGDQWIALDCLDSYGTKYELFEKEPEDVN